MKRILVIEDEASVAILEKDYLEANGFYVDIEYTGEAGVKKALAEAYDLLILDIMLPGVDGFEICRQVRSVKDIPILMVSARKEDIDKIKGLGLGADDYITKPFSPGELVARVKAHISRYERLVGNSGNKNELVSIRGILIDKTARRVFANNEEIIFTAREYDLFLFLASNPNKVFRKEDLFDRIWGVESIGDISTVTVHINKIREKLADNQCIETVWGVGYRFKL